MPPSPRHSPTSERSGPQSATDLNPVLTCLVAWLIPGGAHLLHGHARKAAVLGGALLAMFVVGIAAGGRLFPLQGTDILVLLAAVAQWALFLPRVIAGLAGFGAGAVTAASYEYGNTFLIAAGLLNTLVLLDAYDLAAHANRKRSS